MSVKYYLSAPLQNFFTDQVGDPLIGGFLYSYKATDHDEKKNIGKIEEPVVAGDFFEDPIQLDASGSVPSPFAMYFADDELYFLVLTNSNQNPLLDPDPANIVRTWDNFGIQEDHKPQTHEVDFTNYILNSQFRFFRKQSYEQSDLTDLNSFMYIADTGWFFKRNVNSGDTSVSFEQFVAGQTDVPNNPIYYMNAICSSIGSGETEKNFIFKIDDVRSFAGSTIQVAFYAKSSTSSNVELIIIQHFGVSAEVELLKSAQLTNTWAKYTFSIDIPNISGKSIDDDSNYLTIGVKPPLNAVFNISVCNWQLNRGDVLLEYDYKTKEIAQESQRTYQLPFANDINYKLPIVWNGDGYEFDNSEVGKISMFMTSSEEGYLLCDGATYYTDDYIPNTNDKLKYSRLYDKWDDGCITGRTANEWFVNNGAAFGYGTDGFVPIVKTSTDFLITNSKIETDITVWTDNDTGFTFSKIKTGQDYGISVYSNFNFEDYITYEGFVSKNNTFMAIINKSAGAVADATIGTFNISHLDVKILVDGDVSAKEKTMISFDSGGDIDANFKGKYFTFDTPSTSYYVWYRVSGVGVDPAVGGKTGIMVDLPANSSLSTEDIAYLTKLSLEGTTRHKVTFVAASALSGGEYCNIHNSITHYVPYITVDGIGDDPKIGSTKSVLVALSSSDTIVQVRDKFAKAIKRISFQVPNFKGLHVRGSDPEGTYDDNTFRSQRGDIGVGGVTGTLEADTVKAHLHEQTQYAVDYIRAGGSGGTADLPTAAPTTSTGLAETRVRNISVNFFVKY